MGRLQGPDEREAERPEALREEEDTGRGTQRGAPAAQELEGKVGPGDSLPAGREGSGGIKEVVKVKHWAL
jgi:hypothetical protein